MGGILLLVTNDRSDHVPSRGFKSLTIVIWLTDHVPRELLTISRIDSLSDPTLTRKIWTITTVSQNSTRLSHTKSKSYAVDDIEEYR